MWRNNNKFLEESPKDSTSQKPAKFGFAGARNNMSGVIGEIAKSKPSEKEFYEKIKEHVDNATDVRVIFTYQ